MVNAAHRHNPINITTRHVGNARRIHVQYAYAFHALTATGWAFRNNSGASTSTLAAGATLSGAFSVFGGTSVRNDSGIVSFAPQ